MATRGALQLLAAQISVAACAMGAAFAPCLPAQRARGDLGDAPARRAFLSDQE